jgi:hypothetical protein
MKCPHCRYVSFDFLDACKKCGKDLIEIKARHNIVTFRPAFIPTGDLAFNVVLPSSANVSEQEPPIVELEEEAATDIPSEEESKPQLTFEPTNLTLQGGDTADFEEAVGEQAISPKERDMTLSMEEEQGLLLDKRGMEGIIGDGEDPGKTLGVEEFQGRSQGGFMDDEALGLETISAGEHAEPEPSGEVMEKGEGAASVTPLIGGEPELELDMDPLEAPSAPTEEPTPPGQAALFTDLDLLEDQEPEERTESSEPTVKLTSSPVFEKEDIEERGELTEEEDEIFQLDLSEEDIRRLDENK